MNSFINFFLNLNRNGKILLISFFDSILMFFAVFLAFVLFNERLVKFSTGPQISLLISLSTYFLYSYIFLGASRPASWPARAASQRASHDRQSFYYNTFLIG